MVYEITVEVPCECPGLDIECAYSLDVPVTGNLDDVKAYMFQKTYGKAYDGLSWYLEEGAQTLMETLEDLWYSNAFDEVGLYSDPEFKEFLRERYSDIGTSDKAEELAMQELKDDVNSILYGMDDYDIKVLMDDVGDGYLTLEAGSLTEEINLEEYLQEDDSWKWELDE